MKRTRFISSVIGLALSLGCTTEDEQAASDQPLDDQNDVFVSTGKADANGIEDHGWEAQCVLNLVNTASFSVLNSGASLWRVAAEGIVERRDGQDRLPGTADDEAFRDLGELDDVDWVGWLAFDRLSRYAKANGYCPKIAEEYVPVGEETAIGAVIASSMTHVKGQWDKGVRPSRRDAHPKAHGCVNATFEVDNSALPADLRLGVFAQNQTYDAKIRFSNGAFQIAVDKDGDIRGMAIKVLGVPGEKLLDDEKTATTQDFLLINTPVLMVRNALDYVEFAQKTFDGNPVTFFLSLNPLEWHFRELLITVRVLAQKIGSPLLTRYWSTTPSLLGPQNAVKYSARPCDGESTARPEELTDNYLSEVMAAHLLEKDACFEFMVQRQTDPATMPIEDPSLEWSEETSPFIKVATLRIPAQTFLSEAEITACENLSFTPWHSLPEHKPIGGINRARREIYKAISTARHGYNKAERVEPGGTTAPAN